MKIVCIDLLAVRDEKLESKDDYCPSEEELHTDCSSNEENTFHFPVYDVEKFRQAVRSHGVALDAILNSNLTMSLEPKPFAN